MTTSLHRAASTGLVLVALAPLPAQDVAQRAVEPESGHTYLRTEQPMSVYDAQSLAQAVGGTLVTFRSFAEETFVLDNFGAAEPYWIGLEHPRERWDTGEPVEFTHWASGEPARGPFAPFTLMNWEAPGTWHESSGDVTTDRYRAIIELPKGVIPDETATLAARGAKRGVLLCAIHGLTAKDLESAKNPHLNALWKRSAWTFDAGADKSGNPLAGLGACFWGVGSSRSRLASEDPKSSARSMGENLLARLERMREDVNTAALLDDVTLTGILMEGRADLRISNASPRKGGTHKPVADALGRPTPLCAVAAWTRISIPSGAEPTEAERAKDVAAIDKELGTLLAMLEARPEFAREEWWIAVAGIAPVAGKKVKEDDLRAQAAVPLCILAPTAPPGEILDEVALVDLVPTALAFLGFEPRRNWNVDGHALALDRPPAYGANLIVNGNAEAQVSWGQDPFPSITGWRHLAGFQVGRHTREYAGPPDRGQSYFQGGAGRLAQLEQKIDLGAFAADVDRGVVRFVLSGWLGAYRRSNATLECAVEFLNEQRKPIERAVLGPIGASDRREELGAEQGVPLGGMIELETSGKVPRRARSALVTLLASGAGVQQVMADELSLVLEKE